MPTLAAALATSLVLGMRHAADPDHLVAVTAIASRERSLPRAAVVGALWGLGHTVTLLAVGGAIVLAGVVIPPRLGLALELGVAAMLVALGVANLTDRRPPPAWAAARPVAVGAVHGLAGSAAAALLVLPLIRDVRWAAAYLGVFGLGTVLGMALATVAVAAPAVAAGRAAAARFARVERALRLASGAASAAFGLWLAYDVAVGGGLFTGAPRWTPK